MTTDPSQDLFDKLKILLMERETQTQEDLCHALQKQGYAVNQSKISRLLRKMGAVKIVNAEGQVIYSIPREPAPPSMNTPLHQLVLNIVANETMIVICTIPGSASMIARLLDYHQTLVGILGTLAGDDTIFVIPKSIKEIKKIVENIKLLLG